LSAQAKVLLLKVTVGVLQLSDKPFTTAELVNVADPEAFRFKVKGVPITFNVGAMASVTVTTAFNVVVFPLLSFTVITTVLAPKSAQLNTDLLKATERIPQLSDAATFKLLGEITAEPAAGKETVNAGKAVTTGLALSTTVTNTVFVAWLPELSDAVNTTD
jgi:hypothetical protein